MRPTAILASLTLSAALCAQTYDYNRIERNNDPYFRGAPAHPVTGVLDVYGPTNPPEYSLPSSTTGVPAGTLSWRWLPAETNLRREARVVSGFYVMLRYAYSTPDTMLPLSGYVPEFKMHATAARSGGGRDPDLVAAPLVTFGETSTVFVSKGSSLLVSRTLSQPVSVTATDLALSARWKGGEHRDVPGTQCLVGSWFDADYRPITTGFATPTNTLSYVTGTESCLWLSYMEEQAVIMAKSDWGYQRRNANPLPSGYSVSTAQSDMASAPTGSLFGWDVMGGVSQAGNTAIALFNVGPVFAASFPFLGQTLEVNPLDPALGLLASAGYVLTLSPNTPNTKVGFAAGPKLQVPALGAGAIGLSFGAEFLIFDATLSNVTESTQSAWITIVK